MQKSISRVLTLLLASVILLCCVPMAASADGEAYAVLGVQNGDRIILNPQIGGYTDFQHKVTIVDKDQVSTNMSQYGHLTDQVNFTLDPQATGIDSVVFAIDGVTVVTDDKAPYEFALGAEYAGSHTLIATINKTEGGTEVKTIAFTGIYGELSDYRLVNYNSGVLDASNTPTFNGVVSRGEAIENGVLKLSDGNGISTAWLQPDVQTNELRLGDTKLFYVDYDVKKSTADVQFAIQTSRSFRASNLASAGYIQKGMPAGQWVHITIVADYERGWFSAYMNGVLFKSWSQSDTMLASTSDLVTDSITPQFFGGDLYIDNYAVRTYETATNEAKSISLTGLANGEEIALNQNTAPVTFRTIGITGDTGSVYKVAYKVDGEVVATVTSSPFTWDMPFTDVGVSHTVSAVAYTAASEIESAGVSYKTVYMNTWAVRADNNFDSVIDNSTRPSTEKFTLTPRAGYDTFTLADAATLGRSGQVLFFDRTGTYGTPSRLYSDASYSEKKSVIKFDMYLPSGTTPQGDICLFDANLVGVTAGTILIDLSTLETGKWIPVSILVDAKSKYITCTIGDDVYSVLANESMTTALASASNRPRMSINAYTDYYLDNYYVASLQDGTARTDAYLNGYNYVADSYGVDATVSYINMTSEPVDVNVYFALYNGDALVKAWAEPVTVASNGFARVNKNISYAQANGTGTTVKAFCWTPDLQPINVGR